MKLITCSLSLLLVIVIAVALQGLMRSLPPRLIDQCGDGADPRSAPIVVVGVVRSDTLVLRPVPMHKDRSTPLQMRRMHVSVENVLRGDIPGQHVEIYYFTWASAFDGPQPLGMWNVGSRRILWLRRDGGVFRTSCDGWDGCTWGVYSGSHPHLKIKQGEPIERALADIVFTRGEGAINESRFAGAISRGGPAPDSYLIENYRHLALTEHAGVKAAACEALWILLSDPSLREVANAGMQQASCHCRMVEHDSDFGRRRELICGTKGYQHDDPPY
jgi:hypothetical protein